MMRRTGLALGVLTALAAVTGGCGLGGGSASIAHKSTLTVGVKADQPGLGLRGSGGTFTGFDVDVANYVAGKLGVKKVNFVPITSAQREIYLQGGKVDMVVATYSITPARKQKIVFAGPYYVAHQDILVRTGDAAIHNVHDLKGKTLCNAKGANSFNRVKVEKSIAAIEVDGASYSDCVSKLASGGVEAVSTDDLILAGFAAEKGGTLKMVNQPFSDEKYGIGIKQGDIEGCEDVNKAITDMYQDGTAARLLHKWFDASELQVNTNVPQFEGCS